MNRFFIPIECIHADSVRFPADAGHQITRVLRLKPGEHVMVMDGSGDEIEVNLTDVSPEATCGSILSRRTAPGEPQAKVTLYLGLTQREKFEWMLQKCTEVGAAAFVPMITTRSLVQDAAEAARKLERWQKIVQEAAEQSGRGRVPVVHAPVKFSATIQDQKQYDAGLFAWEEEHALMITTALAQSVHQGRMKVAVWIGPEGGFTVQEASSAQQAGIQAVTLGPRILRMETAAVAATVLVIHQLEN